MKKYLILLLILISMNSCWIGYNGADFSEPVIISKCERSDLVGYSEYYGFTIWQPGFSMSHSYSFRDKTGKFNVGDTIQITK